MVVYNIDNQYKLAIEVKAHKLRLIVLENEQEFVCRTERISVIKRFFEQKEGQIFKGRLQLKHWHDRVQIFVKKVMIGSIERGIFESELNKIEKVRLGERNT